MTLFRALGHRPFALLWAGQTISRFGDGVHLVALAWWVLEKTGSAGAMGTVLLVATVPELLFLLVGGVAVDRLPRLRLMLASDLLAGAIVLVVAFLAWQDRLVFWHVLVMAAPFGLVRAVFFPASIAIVPDLLPPEALPSANSLRRIGGRLAGIAGPAAGGLLVARGGTSLAFALDGASFLLSAVCIAAIPRRPTRDRPVAGRAGAFGDLRLGFATVLASPWLWLTIAIAGCSNLALAGPMGAALPLLVRDDLGAGVRTFAALTGLVAVGAIAASIALGRRSRLRRRGRLSVGAWLLAAPMVAVMGLLVSLVGVGLAMLVFGGADAVLNLVWANTLQEMVPSDRLGGSPASTPSVPRRCCRAATRWPASPPTASAPRSSSSSAVASARS